MITDILITQEGHLGILTLNRPQSLNALTLPMIRRLTQQLKIWQIDSNIHAVIIQAVEGKAFCAGGDVRWLYEMGQAQDPQQQQFFIEEYQLNQLIYHYPKPYIAFMNGFTMGGGVGISLHGSHRIASASFVFAMPETTIGFFPDVGASYLLSRCQGMMGIYLGLTGNRLNAQEALTQGLVTHTQDFSLFAKIRTALTELDLTTDAHQRVTTCLDELCQSAPEIFSAQFRIDECFAYSEIEEIINVLENGNDSWHHEMAAAILKKSPLSLKVTLKQIHLAKSLDFDACLEMDATLVKHFIQDPDFYEGVRALLIDKDKSPHWQPATFAEIPTGKVESYFMA